MNNLDDNLQKKLPGLSKACFVGTPGETLMDSDKVQILKHCLDKSKVKEAITKHSFGLDIDGKFEDAIDPDGLLIELGLNK